MNVGPSHSSSAAVESSGRPAAGSAPARNWGSLLHWCASFVAGALAGYVAFFCIERFGYYFQIPAHLAPLTLKERPTPEEVAILTEALQVREYQNTALQVAILGSIAGAFLGLVEGLARRSVLATLVGGVGGALLGGIAGAAGGVVDLYTLSWLWSMDFEMTFKSMTAHSIAYLLTGVGIAIVVGLTRRRLLPTLGVVLAAALLAGLIYPGVAAHFWPIENTDAAVPMPIFERGPLLLWTMLPAVLIGLAIARTGTVTRPAVPVPAAA